MGQISSNFNPQYYCNTIPSSNSSAAKDVGSAKADNASFETDKIIVKNKLSGERLLNGTIGGSEFDLDCASENKSIAGSINGQPVDLKSEKTGHFWSDNRSLKGNVGNAPVDLAVCDGLKGRNLKGKFEGKDVDVTITQGLLSTSIKGTCDGKPVDVSTKDLKKFKGTLENGSQDLMPVVLAEAYSYKDKTELEAAAMAEQQAMQQQQFQMQTDAANNFQMQQMMNPPPGMM